MRGKRAKQYRKLMQQYGLTFGFREPYQVLVDAQMVQDVERFKMDFVSGLERTLSGKVKPMITQCSIRHLYSLNSPDITSSQKENLIAMAKTMERRRCNHHELERPLAPLECISSVVDPKRSGTNKNRYIIASQEENVRRFCRGLKGVPLIYVKRSVMVMEPMSEGSMGVRDSTEKEKFRQGLRGRVAGLGKRKREYEDDGNVPEINNTERKAVADGKEPTLKKKRTRGPKGPNPLSVKKAKSETRTKTASLDAKIRPEAILKSSITVENEAHVNDFDGKKTSASHPLERKKRRRQKHKPRDALPAAHNGERNTLPSANDGKT